MPVQAEAQPSRRFLVTWRDGGDPPAVHDVGCLTATPDEFSFDYLPGATTAPGFRALPGLPDLGRRRVAPVLFLFFADRLMDRRRPEFASYLWALDLPSTATPLDVLSRSQGVTRGDHVTVIEEPAVAADRSTSHVFIVRGVRFAGSVVGDLERLVPGDVLDVRPDPANPVNPDALKLVSISDDPIGWVPDALVPYVRAVVLQGGGRVTVWQRNDVTTPPHLRLLARVEGRLPIGLTSMPPLERTHELTAG